MHFRMEKMAAPGNPRTASPPGGGRFSPLLLQGSEDLWSALPPHRGHAPEPRVSSACGVVRDRSLACFTATGEPRTDRAEPPAVGDHPAAGMASSGKPCSAHAREQDREPWHPVRPAGTVPCCVGMKRGPQPPKPAGRDHPAPHACARVGRGPQQPVRPAGKAPCRASARAQRGVPGRHNRLAEIALPRTDAQG